MAIRGGLRPTVAAAVLLGLTACGQHSATSSTPPPSASAGPVSAGLVLRVEETGGFASPSFTSGRLPLVSVYADGRVISGGPMIDTSPPPALPNLQEHRIAPSAVQTLVEKALEAGLADPSDLGSPPIADATSTRFTVVTPAHTYVREAYALTEAQGSARGLSEQQRTARAKLSDLVGALTGTSANGATSDYAPTAVAVLASAWSAPQDGRAQADKQWPGPALPGTPLDGRPDVTCATATGDQAQQVLAAARSANADTPWATSDGARWKVTFRPLLPDEKSCGDLHG